MQEEYDALGVEHHPQVMLVGLKADGPDAPAGGSRREVSVEEAEALAATLTAPHGGVRYTEASSRYDRGVARAVFTLTRGVCRAIKAGQLSAPPLRCANSTKLPLPAKARAERPWSARIERLHPRLNRVFSASWRP